MENELKPAKGQSDDLITLDSIIDGTPTVNTPPANPPVNPPVTTPSNTPTNPPANPEPPSTGENLETFEGIISAFTSETISEDAKGLRSELLNMFKASNIDKQGNLLNDANEVLFTAEQIKEYIESDKLPLNEKGELINSKGEAINITQEDSRPIVDVIREDLGVQLGIELPHDFTVADNLEGITKLVQEAIKTANTKSIVNFLDSNPIMKDFYQHLKLGYNPSDFTAENIDYKSIDTTTLDNIAKLDFINKYYKKQGIANTSNLLEALKKGGEDVVNAELATALTYLDNKQKEERTNRDNLLRQQALEEAQEVENYWNQVNSTITKGKLGNINIPIKERQAFFDYLSKPIDKEGNSAVMKDIENEDLEFQLMTDFLRFKKYNLSELVAVLAKENKVLSLREKLEKSKKEFQTGKGVPTTGSSNKDFNVHPTLDTIA